MSRPRTTTFGSRRDEAWIAGSVFRRLQAHIEALAFRRGSFTRIAHVSIQRARVELHDLACGDIVVHVDQPSVLAKSYLFTVRGLSGLGRPVVEERG